MEFDENAGREYDYNVLLTLITALSRPATAAPAETVRQTLVKYVSLEPGRLERCLFECQARQGDVLGLLAHLVAGLPETRALVAAALQALDELEENARDFDPFPLYDEERWSAARKAAKEAIQASQAFPRPVPRG